MEKISQYVKLIYTFYAKYGFYTTLKIIFKKIKSKNIKLYSKINEKTDDDFDKKYNIDTTVIVSEVELKTKSKNWKYASRYEPISSNFSLQQILSSFQINLSEYIFIDLGAGKGRPIIMASMLPFKAIIGVEFSAPLIDIARDNILKFPQHLQLCKDIRFYVLDASEYIFPDSKEKFILFMFNPFSHQILENVLKNLTKSFYENPRHLIIIFVNPTIECKSLIEKVKFIRNHEKINKSNLNSWDVFTYETK